jgi:UDP-3-O-[3-hydroxymyristoyl] glucosamine N-acyltransferase
VEQFAARASSVAHLPVRDPEGPSEVHATAVIHPTAVLGAGTQIGPHCVIEAGVRIGAGTVLYAGCFVGPGCQVGESCVLFPRVTLYEWTELGNRVRIHSGAVLGSDGFGYAPDRQGGRVVGHRKIHHLGRVQVGDDVEIGANSCVDRGTLSDTVIGANAKVDNLVHIGHNARLDEGAVICGGTCLAGNASVGKYAYVGGLTGISNNVHVGDGAIVGAVSFVSRDVAPGSTAAGNPQREVRDHLRAHALLGRLIEGRVRERPSARSEENPGLL